MSSPSDFKWSLLRDFDSTRHRHRNRRRGRHGAGAPSSMRQVWADSCPPAGTFVSAGGQFLLAANGHFHVRPWAVFHVRRQSRSPAGSGRTIRLVPSTPTKHHFVPQMLLRRFAHESRLWHLSIERAEQLRLTSPRDMGHVNNGHTIVTHEGERDRASLEREMSKIEGAASAAIAALADEDIAIVPPELAEPIAWLASLQEARSRAWLGYVAAQRGCPRMTIRSRGQLVRFNPCSCAPALSASWRAGACVTTTLWNRRRNGTLSHTPCWACGGT